MGFAAHNKQVKDDFIEPLLVLLHLLTMQVVIKVVLGSGQVQLELQCLNYVELVRHHPVEGNIAPVFNRGRVDFFMLHCDQHAGVGSHQQYILPPLPLQLHPLVEIIHTQLPGLPP